MTPLQIGYVEPNPILLAQDFIIAGDFPEAEGTVTFTLPGWTPSTGQLAIRSWTTTKIKVAMPAFISTKPGAAQARRSVVVPSPRVRPLSAGSGASR